MLCCRAEGGYCELCDLLVGLPGLHGRQPDGVIRQVHTASRGTYGSRRVTAELVLGRGISVGHGQVEQLVARADLAGLPGRRRGRHAKPDTHAANLVNRTFVRDCPNAL
jgi:putative transposase